MNKKNTTYYVVVGLIEVAGVILFLLNQNEKIRFFLGPLLIMFIIISIIGIIDTGENCKSSSDTKDIGVFIGAFIVSLFSSIFFGAAAMNGDIVWISFIGHMVGITIGIALIGIKRNAE